MTPTVSLSLVLALSTLVRLGPYTCFPTDSPLAGKLASIVWKWRRSNTSPKVMEQQCLALLKEYKKPEHKGMVYAEIACAYAQLDPASEYWPDVVIYFNKAQQYPLNAAEGAWLYGNMARITSARLKGKPREEIERETMKWYLRAIRHLQRFLTQRDRQPVPEGGQLLFRMAGTPEERKRREKEDARQTAERRRIMFQNDLIQQRETILWEWSATCRDYPNLEADFEKSAHKILQDETAVEDVMKCVRKLLKEKRAERNR